VNVAQRLELSPWGFSRQARYITPFYGRRFDIEGGIFQHGKSCLLPDQGVRYQNTVFEWF
jgi:hypothetical protein